PRGASRVIRSIRAPGLDSARAHGEGRAHSTGTAHEGRVGSSRGGGFHSGPRRFYRLAGSQWPEVRSEASARGIRRGKARGGGTGRLPFSVSARADRKGPFQDRPRGCAQLFWREHVTNVCGRGSKGGEEWSLQQFY